MKRRLRLAAIVQVGLGALWLLDGLLQLQPAMLTSAFAKAFLAGTAVGQPQWLGAVLLWSAHLWGLHPLAADLTAALIQLAIGVGLLSGVARLSRWALLVSIAWGTVVWVFGEGLGGLLTPGASALTGSPGSALIYVVLAIWLLGRAQPTGLRRILAGYFGLAFLLQVWSGAGHAASFHQQLLALAASSAPSWVSLPTWWAVRAMGTHAGAWALAASILMLMLGALWVWFPRWTGTSVMSMALMGAVWWGFMEFGVFGGMGTDPNTSPLIILMAGAWMSALQAEEESLRVDALPRRQPSPLVREPYERRLGALRGPAASWSAIAPRKLAPRRAMGLVRIRSPRWEPGPSAGEIAGFHDGRGDPREIQ